MAGEPCEGVHGVNHEVVDGAAVKAGLEVPVRATGVVVEGVMTGDVGGDDLADDAVAEEAACGAERGGVAKGEGHEDAEVLLFAEGADAADFIEAGAEGFVGEYVLAGFEGVDGVGAAAAEGVADGEDVEVGPGEEFLY